MAYNVLDVAKYIINYNNDKGLIISNLKLQKLLYFCWVDYYKKTKKYLFNETMQAWRFGPVVSEVYYEYYLYAGTPIFDHYDDVAIKFDDEKILNNILEEYIYMQPSELVNLTHNTNLSWFKTYKNGDGDKLSIPYRTIIINDCDLNNG